MVKMVIDYPHVRNHEHHIDISCYLSKMIDVPEDIELLPIENDNILDD